jgi:hypothetical protein
MVDETHVLRRLSELRDWAAYIHESLTEDQRYERGKLALLERQIGSEALKLVREEARVLLERLRALAREADLKPAGVP